MHLYTKKKLECQTLYDYIDNQQKDFLIRENEIRQQIVEYSNEAKKIEQEYAEDQKRNLTYYWEKKVRIGEIQCLLYSINLLAFFIDGKLEEGHGTQREGIQRRN